MRRVNRSRNLGLAPLRARLSTGHDIADSGPLSLTASPTAPERSRAVGRQVDVLFTGPASSLAQPVTAGREPGGRAPQREGALLQQAGLAPPSPPRWRDDDTSGFDRDPTSACQSRTRIASTLPTTSYRLYQNRLIRSPGSRTFCQLHRDSGRPWTAAADRYRQQGRSSALEPVQPPILSSPHQSRARSPVRRNRDVGDTASPSRPGWHQAAGSGQPRALRNRDGRGSAGISILGRVVLTVRHLRRDGAPGTARAAGRRKQAAGA